MLHCCRGAACAAVQHAGACHSNPQAADAVLMFPLPCAAGAPIRAWEGATRLPFSLTSLQLDDIDEAVSLAPVGAHVQNFIS